MTRREARENAVGLLFEFGFRPDADAASIYDAAAEVREMPEDEFEKGLFLGTVENLDAIDAAIAENAHGWKMGRLSNVARAVLRLGTYEILFTDVPDSVAVNEAIEIIKKYDDAKVRSFVNGILNAVMKSKADASSDNDAEGEK
ncbi:n utilization substance protein B homolog [Anaerotruncus sp. CAG:390]|nr:n utilization substance protein B homolog [Anaerotruncus sp. CAG:390]